MVLFAILAAAGCLPPQPPPPPPFPTPPPGVDLTPGASVLYGDSLVVNAHNYFQPGATIRDANGMAACDWKSRMAQDAQQNPAVVVLAFVGNMHGPCTMNRGSRYDVYLADIRWAMAEFPGAQVYAVIPPPVQPPGSTYEGLGPNNADVVQAVHDSGVATLDALTPLSNSGAYTDTAPCLGDEGAAEGCSGGQITIRYSDGVHFCSTGNCDVPYSSGARRFADAISPAWLAVPPATTTTSTSSTTSTTSTTTTT